MIEIIVAGLRSPCMGRTFSWYREGIQFTEDVQKNGSTLYLRVSSVWDEPMKGTEALTSFRAFALQAAIDSRQKRYEDGRVLEVSVLKVNKEQHPVSFYSQFLP